MAFGRDKSKNEDEGVTPLERLAGQGGDRERGADDRTGGPGSGGNRGAEAVGDRDHGRDDHDRGRDHDDRGDDHGRGRGGDHDRDRDKGRDKGRDHDSAGGAGGPVSRKQRDAMHERQEEEFGGLKVGSAFFGYLVAVGISVLTIAIFGAAGAAVGAAALGSTDAATQSAGTVSIVGAALALLALAIAYFCGGYVSGRMARFGGAKQGIAVWVISILVTILAGIAGAVLGSQYNVFNQLQLPSVPVSGSSLQLGGIIALVVFVVVTLLAAILGGKAGERWHSKVDRVG